MPAAGAALAAATTATARGARRSTPSSVAATWRADAATAGTATAGAAFVVTRTGVAGVVSRTRVPAAEGDVETPVAGAGPTAVGGAGLIPPSVNGAGGFAIGGMASGGISDRVDALARGFGSAREASVVVAVCEVPARRTRDASAGGPDGVTGCASTVGGVFAALERRDGALSGETTDSPAAAVGATRRVARFRGASDAACPTVADAGDAGAAPSTLRARRTGRETSAGSVAGGVAAFLRGARFLGGISSLMA